MADEAALERLSSRMIRAYKARCAARAEVPEGECEIASELDLQAHEIHCQLIREGTLARVRQGSTWILVLVWNRKYGMRVLTQGSREHVERFELDVRVHGPPGGPEFHGQRLGWRHVGGDDTLHAVSIGGEFRLMPLIGEGHLLMFARNDSGLCVLGLGDQEDLMRTAHQRLMDFRGEPLRVRIGADRFPLRCVAAATVLGNIELFGSAKLMLGHLAGEHFGLFYIHGETCRLLGLYTLAELRHGDLGQVLGWTCEDLQHANEANDRPGAQPRPASRPAPPPSPRRPRQTVTLAAKDWELLDRHLTLESPTGHAATILPRLLEGLRAPARLALGNQLLRASEVKRLLAEKVGIEICCCTKTFGRALARIAAHTRLVFRTGKSKRWSFHWGDLLLVDSELLRWIAAVTPEGPPPAAPPVEEPVTASVPTPALTLTEPSLTPPVSHKPIQTSVGTPVWPTPAPTIVSGTPDSKTTLATMTISVSPGSEAVPLATEQTAGPPEHDDVLEAEQPWLGPAGYRRRYTPGKVRATLSSLPDEESASRWPGKKTRGPPRE